MTNLPDMIEAFGNTISFPALSDVSVVNVELIFVTLPVYFSSPLPIYTSSPTAKGSLSTILATFMIRMPACIIAELGTMYSEPVSEMTFVYMKLISSTVPCILSFTMRIESPIFAGYVVSIRPPERMFPVNVDRAIPIIIALNVDRATPPPTSTV